MSEARVFSQVSLSLWSAVLYCNCLSLTFQAEFCFAPDIPTVLFQMCVRLRPLLRFPDLRLPACPIRKESGLWRNLAYSISVPGLRPLHLLSCSDWRAGAIRCHRNEEPLPNVLVRPGKSERYAILCVNVSIYIKRVQRSSYTLKRGSIWHGLISVSGRVAKSNWEGERWRHRWRRWRRGGN